MKKKIWRIVYRYLASPLLYIAFRLLAVFNRKVKTGFEMRRRNSSGQPRWAAGIKSLRPIWIHCASGEFEYAKPVITRIKAREPRAKILVTYFSPSAAKAVSHFPGVDIASPSPWETPRALNELLKFHQPQLLLLARTDTWPEMLAQVKKHGIPSLLFSATLSKESGRANGLMKKISELVFSDLTQIFCVSEEDRKLFSKLGVEDRARVAGDTRFDQVLERLTEPKAIKLELFANFASPGGAQSEKGASCLPLLIAGSTWPEDEEILLRVLQSIKGQIRCVLVPHEPTAAHLSQLEAQLARSGLTFIRYSQASEWKNEDVLLVDQVGILAELYQMGPFAFVGGSFKKGVHSVMEPLAAGCLTILGPHHKNNREALELSRVSCGSGFHCVEVVNSSESWTALLQRALHQFSSSESLKVKSEIKTRSGKSDLVVDWALARAKFPTTVNE